MLMSIIYDIFFVVGNIHFNLILDIFSQFQIFNEFRFCWYIIESKTSFIYLYTSYRTLVQYICNLYVYISNIIFNTLKMDFWVVWRAQSPMVITKYISLLSRAFLPSFFPIRALIIQLYDVHNNRPKLVYYAYTIL